MPRKPLRTEEAAHIALRRLTLINIVAVWINASGYMEFARTAAAGPGPYVWATFLIHFLLLNVLLFGALWAAARALPRLVALFLAPLLFSCEHFFFQLDAKIYSQFSFHVNGMVLQVIQQPDAGKVLGINFSEVRWAVLTGAAFLAAEFTAAWLLYRFSRPKAESTSSGKSRIPAYVLLALVGLAVTDKVTYAVYAFKGDRTLLAQARVIPFYVPVTLNTMLGKLLDKNPYESGTVEEEAGSFLQYPRHPITVKPGSARPNIFWINVESWRADSISPELSPRLWAYRSDFLQARQHFSGGNATRLGMFSLFYGLNPSYWDAFLAERRGPVLFDLLVKLGYRLDVLSSASLNFLGTRDTVFRQVRNIQQDFYDRPEVSDVVMQRKAFAGLDRGSPGQPVFQFQFFDSPHAKYRFLPGFDPFKPYVTNINGLDKSASALREQVFNRYHNATHFTDLLIGRYLDELKRRGLFNDAVIVITGDHGEEFWEHGHFTHSSGFADEQLRVPFWIHVPGKPGGELNRLTSHMDAVPTLFEALGVENPPSDYSQGFPLYGPPREWALASGWGNYVVIDADTKISFYASNFSFSLSSVTDRHDDPLDTPNDVIFKRKGPRLMQVFNQFGEFLAKPATR